MTDSTTEMDQVERDKLMSRAYTTAQSDLRKTHHDEFNALYQQRCAELGVHWEPRKSKQEQALDQMLTLLTEYPALAEKLAEKLAAGSGESPG
jgi:hypothetical protein